MAERVFLRATELPVGPDAAFAWHLRPGALVRLLPGFQRAVVEVEPAVEPGARGVLRLRRGPLAVRWVARITEVDHAARRFVDEQEAGPFAAWRHEHRVEDVPDRPGAARLVDEVRWRALLGPLGAALAPRLVERRLARVFAWRHRVTRHDLALHARYGLPRLRVGITGATGLVGARLAAFLSTGGHDVVRFVRRPPRDATEVRWDTARWSPVSSAADRAALEGLDAVVHLAGEPVAALRWTAAKKARILQSRVAGSRALIEGLRALDRPPGVFVSASAVGFYGARGEEVLTEESAPGEGFLADTARAWEAETARAGDFARVVQLRLGVVLDAAGGALRTMLPAFRAGAGGPFADGRAWFPWVALDDVLGACLHALATGSLVGPANVVAPGEVRQGEFARALGRALRRPTWLPVPRIALRGALGRELAEEMLLASVRARPAALLESGFEFAHPSLDGALAHVLGTALQPRGELVEQLRSNDPWRGR